MTAIPASQAAAELDRILEEAAQGHDVVIVGADGTVFKLIALPRVPKPVFGSARGLVDIRPDFDDPIEGLQDYMP